MEKIRQRSRGRMEKKTANNRAEGTEGKYVEKSKECEQQREWRKGGKVNRK